MRRIIITLFALAALIFALPALVHAQAPAAADLARTVDSIAAIPKDQLRARDIAQLRRISYQYDQLERQAIQRVSSLHRQLSEISPDGTSTASTSRPAAAHSAAAGATLTLAASAAGFAGGRADRDAGGYADDFRPRVDKLAHGFGSTIAGRAFSDRVGPGWGVLSCAALGSALELGQSRDHGRASLQDATYDAGGCLVGSTWSWLARRRSR